MIRCISIILGILSWAMSRRLSQLTCLWMSLQEASRQLGNLTGLLKLSVLGLSFVFYVKAERTQQGNLLVVGEPDWPCLESRRVATDASAEGTWKWATKCLSPRPTSPDCAFVFCDLPSAPELATVWIPSPFLCLLTFPSKSKQGPRYSIRMIIWIFCCDTLWWWWVFLLYQISDFQRVRLQCCLTDTSLYSFLS